MPSPSSITSTGGTSAGCWSWSLRVMALSSVHFDAPRLGGCLSRDADVQHAVAVAGAHLGRVEVVGQGDDAMEAPGEALVDVHARALVRLGQRGGALARDAEHAALDLHVDRLRLEPRG